MQYKIIKSKQVTSKSGKNYKQATIANESGVETDVSVWPDFDQYAQVETGSEVEGIVVENNGYQNLKSENKKSYSGGINKMMQKKEESIEKFQGTKNEAIKLAGASRDATLMVTTLFPILYSNYREEDLKKKWNEWRDFFYDEFNNVKPF